MRKTFFYTYVCIAVLMSGMILPINLRAQVNVASWVGYNSFTDVFPIAAARTSPALISSAVINSNGLVKTNNKEASWMNDNASSMLDIQSAPYLSFALQLQTAQINFDKFVITRLAVENKSTRAQLRWSMNDFATALGEFKTGAENELSFTSVDLSSLPFVAAKNVEFRIYFYNGRGHIIHAEKGRYTATDGTPAYYLSQNGVASIWVKDAVVPTTIEKFRGKLESSVIKLKWQTSVKEDISHFEIERSTDGISFYNAGKVTALGVPDEINKYHFTDRTCTDSSKIIFYRLWMLDNKGNSSYSSTIPILIKNTSDVVVFYPDPDAAIATVIITSAKEETARYTILDSNSRKLQTGKYALLQGSNSFNLNMEQFSRGTYILEVAGININSRLRFNK